MRYFHRPSLEVIYIPSVKTQSHNPNLILNLNQSLSPNLTSWKLLRDVAF